MDTLKHVERRLEFQVVDPKAEDVAEILARHHAMMREQTPPDSCHVKSSDDLADAGAMMFALREQSSSAVLAVGALVPLGAGHLELKSMHVIAAERGTGLGHVLVQQLINHAGKAGAKRLSLETGSGSDHAAARALYEKAGFQSCPPFGDYADDPLSTFMKKTL